jgi:glycosyltransferase involved in cell wall biosynthesis
VTVIHDVDAYNLLHKGPEPEPAAEPEGVHVIRLRSSLGSLSCLLTQQTGRPVVNGRRIRGILEKGGFHVVNFHNVSLIGGPGILSYGGDALRLYMAHEHWLVCPMHVLWRHGRELCTGRECLRCSANYRRPPQLYRYSGFMEAQLEHVDRFIAMSEFSRDKHHEFGFAHAMDVVPYFLPDPDEAGAPAPGPRPHDRPYFLFVGRLERIKGLDDVIPLFRDYREADLLIAGDGVDGERLRSLGADLDRVRFLGRVPLEETRRYYEHALGLIVPSVCYETFGIILIEAFSHGTPVIARRLGPFPEIVEQSGGGELFESPEELLAAMRRLQSDPEHRRRLSRNGSAAFRGRWVESAVIPRYLNVVREAAVRRGRNDIVAALSQTEAT